MVEFLIKSYEELSLDDLYNLLQLRSEIFVVEQNCAFQDMDGLDRKSLHVLGYKDNQLVAYSRLFKPEDYFEFASIGRVVVKEGERHSGLGQKLMKISIQEIKKRFNQSVIKLSSQCYITKFYRSVGFREIGEIYLEDNIPHISMIYDCNHSAY